MQGFFHGRITNGYRKRMRRDLSWTTECLWFALFVLLYEAPVGWMLPGWMHGNAGASATVQEALATPAVQREILRHLLAHLALIGACYLPLRSLANFAAVRWQLDGRLARLAYLLLGWMLLAAGNAVWFPLSNYSVAVGWVATPWVLVVVAALLGVTAALWAWDRVRVLTFSRRAAAPLLVAGLAGVAGSLWLVPLREAQGEAAMAAPRRNVILIGIDSLSAALLEREQHHLPHLQALLRSSVRYERAYTPLARTFPAWMSVLSGQPPAVHGAIFNLRNLEHVQREGLLPHTLKAQAYRTVYAIDERCFNHIDEGFGFDAVVGPEAGVLDFAVQAVNDSPLTNLLLQTRLAHLLLPYSRVNVASHANYDAAGFVEEIAAATAGAPRLFLATHFLAGHFPFQSRHARIRHGSTNGLLARHVEALSGVDAQVGHLLAELRRQGHLEDALVVVLSDHGEQLGELEAHTTRDGHPVELKGYGHGVDLLSDHANRVVLALVRFAGGQVVSEPEVRHEQVSLLDLRGAVEHYVRTGEVALQPAQACMQVETGLRLNAIRNYRKLKAGDVVREAQGLYEIDVQGRMRLKEEMLPVLVRTKDVGWRCPDRITYYRAAQGRYYTYRIDAGHGTLREERPDPQDVAAIEHYRRQLERQASASRAH